METCLTHIRGVKRNIAYLLFPYDGADRKVIEMMEKVIFMKTFLGSIGKIVCSGVIWFYGNHNWELA